MFSTNFKNICCSFAKKVFENSKIYMVAKMADML